MTLALCLKNKDTIVMASDSREIVANEYITFTDIVNKLEFINQDIVITSAGNSSLFANKLLDYAKMKMQNNNDIDDMYAEDMLAFYIRKNYEYHMGTWLKDHQITNELAIFYLVGLFKGNEPEIYIFNNMNSNEAPFIPYKTNTDYYSVGKPTIADYLVRKIRRHTIIKELDTSTLKKIAVYLIHEVAKVENEVELPLNMAVLKQNRLDIIDGNEINAIINSLSKILDDKHLIRGLIGD